jgi:deoxyribodipyrimidine photo-lyase
LSKNITIHWFRKDLRLSDNPALYNAASSGVVLPIYILDDINSGVFKMGSASRCWLHHSLKSLNQSLGGKLQVFVGDPLNILPELAKKYKISNITWNRCYEPWQIKIDTKLKQILINLEIKVNSYNGSLLWEPWDVLKKDGLAYKVFTPFYHNGCLKAKEPRLPLPSPPKLLLIETEKSLDKIEQLGLLPKLEWGKTLISHWHIGELAANERLADFLDKDIQSYKEGRDFPAMSSVSRLSPHLHFGEISPNQAWYGARSFSLDSNIDHFCRELAWREFSYSLLYFNHELATKNLQQKFDFFPWRYDSKQLSLWQEGKTGIPIVDAGMRQLWQTGYMHNRIRMVVSSFLVKNLLLDWRDGARWFWECLFDADLANNSASWQWVSGCGADAAPYFRIFNPVTQGQKFDQSGEYTRYFVPELKLLPDKYLFNPWEAPVEVLQTAKVELGINYPLPIVDLYSSRVRALTALKSLIS